MKKPVVLRIYKGDQLLGVKQFIEPQIVIGRPGDVQIALEGDNVSVIHAAIEERDSAYFVCDLGSSTGTSKNGESVLDAQLESGDILQIADYRIEFYIGVPRPKVPPPGAAQRNSTADSRVAIEPTAPLTPSVSPVIVPMPPTPAQDPVVDPAATTPMTRPAVPFEAVAVPKNSAAEQTVDKTAKAAPINPTQAAVAGAASVSATSVPATPTSTEQGAATAQSGATDQSRATAQSAPTTAAGTQAPTPQSQTAPVAAQSSKADRVSQAVASPTTTPVTPSSAAAAAVAMGSAVAGAQSMGAQTLGGGQTSPSASSSASFSLGTSRGRATRRHEPAKKKRGRKTFAPPSSHTSVKEFVKPSKGTVVEVLVAWRERVIATYHFSKKQTITMGSRPDCDVVLPMFASRARRIPLIKIDSQAQVIVTSEMTGELIRGQSSSTFVELLRQNRMIKQGAAYAVVLEQGEMIRLELAEQISIVVRYVSDSPKPIIAPILDLTTAEFTGIILSGVLVSLLSLYMFLYSPPKALPEEVDQEPLRAAFVLIPPTPVPLKPPAPPVAKTEPTPLPAPPTPPPQIVKATPAPTKQIVKEAKTQPAKAPQHATNLTNKQDPGKAANAAPNKNTKGPRALTSPRQGGSVKTAEKDGSQLKSPKRDVTRSGVFSVLGAGGANTELAQSTSGSGEIAGLANAATGRSGYGETRPGQGLGSATKDTGRGGTGTAFSGIAGGVGTQGRGSGNTGYGTGGLGNKAGVKIVTGGTEESFSGTIDREAIRRVILANYRTIKTCYERQLNRNPELFGKLVLKWEIGEQGRVVSVGVKDNELGNREVADCILARLRTWKFPEPPANQVVEVAYPFFFSN